MTIRATATIVALALALASCGDPNGAYVDEAVAVIDTMRTESIAATPRAGAVTRDGVIGVNEARRAGAAALARIDAPDDLRLEHLAVVAALEDLVGRVDEFLADTADLNDDALASAASEALDLQALADTVGRACTTLDARVAELGYEADIRC